jgi:hypothetical protein
MGQELDESKIIKFNDIHAAAAHARLILPKSKWIAFDENKLIFFYTLPPIPGKDIWMYHAEEPDENTQEPFALYTGQTQWKKSLTKIR